ncbi:uncharacterized protein TNCV_1867961 [Trichonephila clavipes]|nr:uncharacterized protein TNCV_1867961 [Trichonephila clavipes]
MKDVTLMFIKRIRIIPEGDIFQISEKKKNSELTSPTDGLFNGLLCKAVSTSATFVFIMNALPDRFLSATDPASRNRCTKTVIIAALGAVSPGYFC